MRGESLDSLGLADAVQGLVQGLFDFRHRVVRAAPAPPRRR